MFYRRGLRATSARPVLPSGSRAKLMFPRGQRGGVQDILDKTRAHLNHAICRQCWGTGMVDVPAATAAGGARVACVDCAGEGALR